MKTRQLLSKIKHRARLSTLAFFSKTRILSNLYYLIISNKFNREHQSTLAGRLAYYQNNFEINGSVTLLRRNIHRIEKGLIMEPRRDVFAEQYIAETIATYATAVESARAGGLEQKWFSDVLKEYFSVVVDTPIIALARKAFQCVEGTRTEHPESNGSQSNNKKIPYNYDTIDQSNITFQELEKLFRERRSIRWYQNKPVQHELLKQAIDIATQAPSACNRQPFSFHISTTKEKAVEMASIAGGTTGFSDNVPCTIAIVGDLSAYPLERDRHLIYIDASLVAMQLMLALVTIGLSTCPCNWPDVEEREVKMQNLLRLKKHQRPIMLLCVGYPKKDGGVAFSQKKMSNTLIIPV